MRTTTLAFRLLQIALVVLMAGAGADKIFQVSLDWDQYLPAFVPWLLGIAPARMIVMVGVLELGLALGLTLFPRSCGPLVALWLLLISFTLVSGGRFIGLGLLNLVLAILAVAVSDLALAPSSGLGRHTFFLRPKRSLRPV